MQVFNVHLFDVMSERDGDLTELLVRIHSTPKDHRWREVLNQDMSLNDTRVLKPQGLMLLDFVKKRAVGPGKVNRHSNMSDFEFQDGEDFGEETGVLWDVARKWLLVQYNHHGVRAPSIMAYLNQYAHDPEADWIARPVLDPEVENRLKRTALLRSATMKVRLTSMMSAAMRKADVSLGDAIGAAGDRSGALTMEVTFGMSHDKRFLEGKVMRFMRRLRELVDEDDGLYKLQVKGRSSEEGDDEVIDLMQQHIKRSYEARDLEVKNRRYTQDSRWRALLRVHAGFVQDLA